MEADLLGVHCAPIMNSDLFIALLCITSKSEACRTSNVGSLENSQLRFAYSAIKISTYDKALTLPIALASIKFREVIVASIGASES